MARKQNKGGGKRQRAKQRAQYDELDKYPVMPPHAFARIVRDKQTLNIISPNVKDFKPTPFFIATRGRSQIFII